MQELLFFIFIAGIICGMLISNIIDQLTEEKK